MKLENKIGKVMIAKNFIESTILGCSITTLKEVIEAYLPVVNNYENEALKQKQEEVADNFKKTYYALNLALLSIKETRSIPSQTRSQIVDSIRLCEYIYQKALIEKGAWKN